MENWKTKKTSFGLLFGTISLAVLSVGGNCPGTGVSAKFSSAGNTSASGVERAWKTATIIDPNSIDGNTYDQNIILPLSTVAAHAMAVFAESVENFFVLFTRETAGSDVSIYGTQPANFDAGSWASTMGGFTQIDSATTDPEAQRPVSAVNSLGNSVTVYLQDPQAGGETRRVNATRRIAGSSAWISPVDLRASAEVAAAVDVGTSSMAIAVDAYNSFIAVWCSSDNVLYFNHYRSSVGWRFNTASTADATWDGASDCTDSGVDVAFDGYGNGYGAFITTANEVKVRRWQGDTAANWLAAGHKDIANGTTNACYPKLFLTAGGEGHLFFYSNCAGSTGDLYYSKADATASSDPPVSSDFGAASQFDVTGGMGNSYIQDNGDPIYPILKYNGSYAVVGFLKLDSNGVRRFWTSRFDGTSWGTLTAIDAGTGGVTWGDLAINSSGTIAAVYSAENGGTEYVFGRMYESGVWQTVTQFTLPSDLVPGNGATARYHPSIAIDSSGNAVATFTMTDTSGDRRAVGVMYR